MAYVTKCSKECHNIVAYDEKPKNTKEKLFMCSGCEFEMAHRYYGYKYWHEQEEFERWLSEEKGIEMAPCEVLGSAPSIMAGYRIYAVENDDGKVRRFVCEHCNQASMSLLKRKSTLKEKKLRMLCPCGFNEVRRAPIAVVNPDGTKDEIE